MTSLNEKNYLFRYGKKQNYCIDTIFEYKDYFFTNKRCCIIYSNPVRMSRLILNSSVETDKYFILYTYVF